MIDLIFSSVFPMFFVVIFTRVTGHYCHSFNVLQLFQAMDKASRHRADLIETVVTANGRRLGASRLHSAFPPEAVPSSVRLRSKKQRSRDRRIKLFNHNDHVTSREMSNSEFMDSYGVSSRSRGLEKSWDELSLTVRHTF